MSSRFVIISTIFAGVLILVFTTDYSSEHATAERAPIGDNQHTLVNNSESPAGNVGSSGPSAPAANDIKERSDTTWSDFSKSLGLEKHRAVDSANATGSDAATPQIGSYLDDITMETSDEDADRIIEEGLNKEFDQLGITQLEKELDDELAKLEQK